MDVAGLIAWVVTALGGFVLLGRFIAAGGVAQQRAGTTRFPAGLVFGHFGLAATGLVVWIVYVATGTRAVAWVAVALLAGIALLGFAMFRRWMTGAATVPAPSPAMARVPGGSAALGTSPVADATPAVETPAERRLPVPVVYLHGVAAVTTVVLVVLAAAGVGGS